MWQRPATSLTSIWIYVCTYYLAYLPVIQLKDRLAGIVKQNGRNLYICQFRRYFKLKKKSVA